MRKFYITLQSLEFPDIINNYATEGINALDAALFGIDDEGIIPIKFFIEREAVITLQHGGSRSEVILIVDIPTHLGGIFKTISSEIYG